VIDSCSKLGFAKLWGCKSAPTAADMLNDRAIRLFDEHDLRVDSVLTDRGPEHCGAHARHEYELYPAVEGINHTRTRVKSPQTNGICERRHKSLLDEFYRVAFRKKVYATIAALQAALDEWVAHDIDVRSHQGRWCFLQNAGADLPCFRAACARKSMTKRSCMTGFV
jgi:transposase InsO family protein